MIAGQQATDGARATTIAEGLEKAASAMMMYYADNAEVIAVEGVAADKTVTEAKLVVGTNAYLKKTDAIVAEASAAAGKYSVSIQGEAPAQTWWIVYTLPATDIAGVGLILANKANRTGLMTAAGGTTAYAGATATIAMKVRGTASE